MTTLSAGTARFARAPGRDWNGVQFRTILLLCLPVHLVAAAAARLTPAFWSDARAHSSRTHVSRAQASLFAEAWRASNTTARIACSG